ncbi:MAG: hypothetical protein V5B33_19905 [Candidatus Accumulibacter sp. UW20]|jgi:hypothetical protein
MKNARPQTTETSAPNSADYTVIAAHALARRIPILPEPDKLAAVALLLVKLLDLLRTAAS